jgi:hypothetical protein
MNPASETQSESVSNDQTRSCSFGDWNIEGCVENLGPDAAKYMMANSSERASMISSCFTCGTMGGSFAASQSEYLGTEFNVECLVFLSWV